MKLKIKGKIKNLKKEGGSYLLEIESLSSKELFKVIVDSKVKKCNIKLEKNKNVVVLCKKEENEEILKCEFIGGESVIYGEYPKFEVVENGKYFRLIGIKSKKYFRSLIIKDKNLIDKIKNEIGKNKFINVFYVFQRSSNFPKVIYLSFDEILKIN